MSKNKIYPRIKIELRGIDCYLINYCIESTLDNLDELDEGIEEAYINFYMSWLSQDEALHEMLTRHDKNE